VHHIVAENEAIYCNITPSLSREQRVQKSKRGGRKLLLLLSFLQNPQLIKTNLLDWMAIT